MNGSKFSRKGSYSSHRSSGQPTLERWMGTSELEFSRRNSVALSAERKWRKEPGSTLPTRDSTARTAASDAAVIANFQPADLKISDTRSIRHVPTLCDYI